MAHTSYEKIKILSLHQITLCSHNLNDICSEIINAVESIMARRKLTVVSGGLSRKAKPKASPAQNELANRWRDVGPVAPKAPESGDVIPLLDGWIRRLFACFYDPTPETP